MMWFKTLMDESVDSWKDLCDVFTTQFITQKWKPTNMVLLSGVTQRHKETICEYIDRFIKVAVVVMT